MKLTPVMNTMSNMRSVQNNNYQQSPNFGMRDVNIRNYHLNRATKEALRELGSRTLDLSITGINEYQSFFAKLFKRKPELSGIEVRISGGKNYGLYVLPGDADAYTVYKEVEYMCKKEEESQSRRGITLKI